jgi:hypothetical protein
MSWRVVVRPEVADDLKDAAEWYDSRVEGLGDEFIREVLSVLNMHTSHVGRLGRGHETWPVIGG